MIYILAEGHGEIKAATKLVSRICKNLGYDDMIFADAIRCKNLHREDDLLKSIKSIQYRKDAEGLLIIKDEDDKCPKIEAPKIASVIRNQTMPFPISYHLMYREFETLFCAYLDNFKGKEIKHTTIGTIKFKDDVSAPENPETKRDAKGMISKAMQGGRIYKPSVDQLTLTQAMDINILRSLNVPCFGTLERCLTHLKINKGKFSVYPN